MHGHSHVLVFTPPSACVGRAGLTQPGAGDAVQISQVDGKSPTAWNFTVYISLKAGIGSQT